MAEKRRKKQYAAILLGILLVLFLLFFRNENAHEHSISPSYRKNKSHRIDQRTADFRHKRIYYTKHAKCRMNCRQIDESEVKEILKEGRINYNKSDLKKKPCPVYAVEGMTHDRQHVRIVVGNCSSQASVITVIDLEQEFECECD